MRASFSAAVAVLAAEAVTALPTVEKRANNQDVDVLNYALTLEHLEAVFYQQGLNNYSSADFAQAGFPAPFYANLQSVAAEEKTHVTFLTQAINAAGGTPVKQCSYDFGATTPKQFAMVASIVEGVGVSAYLGAAMDITSASYLQAAAQILPVESRHSAYLRKSMGQAGLAQPFDTPLDMDQVYTLVAPMIVKCPAGSPKLPVKAFPSLKLATATPIHAGQVIKFTTKATGGSYAAFIALGGPTFVPIVKSSDGFSVKVPSGFGGQTYVVLTSSKDALTDATTVAGPAVVEIAEILA